MSFKQLHPVIERQWSAAPFVKTSADVILHLDLYKDVITHLGLAAIGASKILVAAIGELGATGAFP